MLKITEQSVKVLDTRGTAFTQEVTRITDQSIKTLDTKGSALTGEVARATDAALGAIDTKGAALARAVLANSDEIVRLITQASGNATAAVGKSLSEFEDKAKLAIEKSQRTSTSAVAEMLETHSMLRNDTSALFERLREANALLQEVLGGANESLGRIESTLSVRVKEFVSALSDINERSASASDHVEQQIKSFHVLTAGVLTDISSMAERFEEQGRALTNAATNLDQSHSHIEATLGQRHQALDHRRRRTGQHDGEPRPALQPLLDAAAGIALGGGKPRSRDRTPDCGFEHRRHPRHHQPVRSGPLDQRG